MNGMNQGGLLGGMMGAQAPTGGLLGGAQPQPAPQSQQSSVNPLQLAQALAQNPTPQTAQAVIAQMRSAGMEGADQIAQILQQAGDDPEAIREIAMAALQALSGQ